MKLNKKLSMFAMGLATTAAAMAANVTTSVGQVSSTVVVADDVDYVITSSTPFSDGGRIDITNTEHAVVIIQNVRPSVVISDWLAGHVYINGVQAVNGMNCQVKMYAHGAIIMPYSSNIKPLTVYSEKNFQGTAVNNFGLEHSGGYMNTLTEEKLNNNIRSFKLKRGYMVTFSTRASGRGYSRCFIADKEDLEISSLPNVLDGTISSYRVFQWYDAQKKGLASDTRAFENGLINSAWCYDWATGVNRLPDTECVPNHIYEDWPSSSACGSVTHSCHMKTNNEPGNSADDHPQKVAEVLANWENLMRTGLRLCSESSHDGSMGHLQEFIDSIDARGWRCDILDLHCYWPSSNFNNWKYWYDRFGGRPIWISEWVWGASWNNNGIFATDRSYSEENQRKNAAELQKMIPWMNASPYVERYAYWNSEADCSKIIKDGELSIAGEYYASVQSGMAYNKQYEKIPNVPRQYDPSQLTASYDAEAGKVTLSWHDENGEYNRAMVVQCRKIGSSVWTDVLTVKQEELAADYNVTVDGLDGYKYRVKVTDLINKERLSNEATAVNENLTFGSGVTVMVNNEVTTKYLGGNMLVNGGFDLGLTDWQNGAGAPLSAPYYQAVPKGGVNNGPYLQCYGGNASKTSEQSIARVIQLESGSAYYVTGSGCNTNPDYHKVMTGTATFPFNKRFEFPAVSSWAGSGAAFVVGSDTYLTIQLTNLEGKAMIDDIIVSKLFDTKEEALADAKQCLMKRVEAFKAYNVFAPQINTMLDSYVADEGLSALEIENAVKTAIECMNNCDVVDSLASDVALIINYSLENANRISELYAAVKNFSEATVQQYLSDVTELKALVNATLAYEVLDGSVENGDFKSIYGWETKCGTYTTGDQSATTHAGKTAWNAWWSISASGNADKTMEVRRTVSVTRPGIYALECKAATQHLCETDQHACLTIGDKTLNSPSLAYGLLDLPNFVDSEKWNTLTTPYVYTDGSEQMTIGFKGSKANAIDGSWIRYGSPTSTPDNREGWWVATDFTLRYVPAQKFTADQSGWGTMCSPYVFSVSDDVKLYNIVGITPDSLYIAIEPNTEAIVAGRPYLFKTEPGKSIIAMQSGTAVNAPKTNVNGLRGIFKATSKYPLGSLVLNGGVWVNQTERTNITSYSAFVYKLSYLPIVAKDWQGEKLPTSGVATAVGSVYDSFNEEPKPAYTLGGQKATSETKGIIVTEGMKVVR